MNPVFAAHMASPSTSGLDAFARSARPKEDAAEKKQFTDTFGQLLFGQLIGAMRKTVGPPAYFHGGRAEEAFRGQLDQVFAEKMSAAAAESIVEPMYDLYRLGRPS